MARQKRPPTREQRIRQHLEDKLDRLRSDLPPEKKPTKRTDRSLWTK